VTIDTRLDISLGVNTNHVQKSLCNFHDHTTFDNIDSHPGGTLSATRSQHETAGLAEDIRPQHNTRFAAYVQHQCQSPLSLCHDAAEAPKFVGGARPYLHWKGDVSQAQGQHVGSGLNSGGCTSTSTTTQTSIATKTNSEGDNSF
jgi:hypothetical protein